MEYHDVLIPNSQSWVFLISYWNKTISDGGITEDFWIIKVHRKNVKTGGGYASHRGWLSIKVTTQLKTSENSWEHRKTPKIIWYHPENNWGPLIDNLVQFEEDFNSGTKKSVGWGGVGSSGDRLCQTSPIPGSPDGDKNTKEKNLFCKKN